MTAQLAVCVPTHHGRAAGLDELLARLAAEPGVTDVEICISDNGSTDATAAVVERHRPSFGERMRYLRSERNVGMAANVLRVMELAQADYCWLMGSDDAPAPGSLARVRRLLDEHAGVSGLALGLKRVHAHDLERPGHLVPPEPFPSQRCVTRFRGRREVALAVGYVTYFTSCNVVHRRRWEAVVTAERDAVLRAGSGPHLYVTAQMAAENPDWVWCPEPLVLSREAELYLADVDELGNRPNAVIRHIFADLDRIWTRVYGRYSYLHRALMFKALRHQWNRESILAQRRSARGPKELLANLACAARFAWSPRFLRRYLPPLVMPAAPLRYSRQTRRAFATHPIPERDRCVSLQAILPAVLTAGYPSWVIVHVVNRGNVPLSSAGPHPVVLGTRWRDRTGGAEIDLIGMRASLWRPLRPGRSRALELLVCPPWEPGSYILNIAPVQEGIAWFGTMPDERPLEAVVRVVDASAACAVAPARS